MLRAYTALDEENLHTMHLLKDWTSEGFLSEAQHLTMKQDLPCGLRRTNVFLRFVFFLFTLISAGAAVGLFVVALSPRNSGDSGFVLLIMAALCYWGAEIAVRREHLYRHGFEEALAVLSVFFLCLGVQLAFFGGTRQSGADAFVPICGAAASLLIYRRFGFQYGFLSAMICVAFAPHYWTTSPTAQHLIIGGAYAAGLITVIYARRNHYFDYLDDDYAITEALLWLGIYAAMNLQISSIDQARHWWYATAGTAGFSKAFYWGTYVLIWCLPIGMTWRALRRRDGVVAAAGVILAIVTLATNKPYLGWQRHAWDPMLLGILLTGTAIAARRWLATGAGGARHGFTAQRLSAADKRIQSAMAVSVGAFSSSTTFTPEPSSDPKFGGGDSGGGGASSDF
jgi:hypothetical protein